MHTARRRAGYGAGADGAFVLDEVEFLGGSGTASRWVGRSLARG